MGGLLLLAYNNYQEDFGSPPAHTLATAIPVLLVGVLLMGVAIWRVRAKGLRAALLRLVVGTLAGIIAFAIGLSIIYS
jgi:hypothetical protein